MGDKIFLGKYRISAEEIQPAGEHSGNSLAYHAEAIDSGKKVVVELVSTSSLKTAAIKRLKAQAIAAKKLDHVNIPHLCDFGVEDDYFIYVTEDYEGIVAEEWVNANGPMPIGPVLRIASQVVSALSAAAFQDIVHQAIHPSNLLLVPHQTAQGEWPLVKVLHFVGAGSTASGTDTAVAAFDKSLHYVSPEQIKNGTVDFRSEIYSLGCTMWFLLTGAPPLAGQKGPIALPQTTVADKASDIPKKVRRLLAQMLSVNPAARLRDPLEFYRKLQECLVQVERRERMSLRFGVPSLVRAPANGVPFFRRPPTKALALAAMLLAIATLAAFFVPRYTRHRRILSAQEPIGVPIGVPDAVAIATPAALNTASPMEANPPQESGTLAQSNSSPPGPVAAVSDRRPVSVLPVDSQRPPLHENQKEAQGSAEATNLKALSRATDSLERSAQHQVNKAPQPATPDLSAGPVAAVSDRRPDSVLAVEGQRPPRQENQKQAKGSAEATNPRTLSPATDSLESAAQNQVNKAPRPATPDVSPNPQGQEPAPVIVDNANRKPATSPSEATSASHVANAPSPAHSRETTARKTAPKTVVLHEVRRAEPAEPEVRRAEPAAPGEGPESRAAVSSKPPKEVAAQIEETRDAETRTSDATPGNGNQIDSESKTAARPPAASQRPAKPKRRLGERVYAPEPMPEFAGPRPPPLPGRSVRARFVGVTPDGRWMMELPSGEVVIVPPPPGRER